MSVSSGAFFSSSCVFVFYCSCVLVFWVCCVFPEFCVLVSLMSCGGLSCLMFVWLLLFPVVSSGSHVCLVGFLVAFLRLFSGPSSHFCLFSPVKCDGYI